MIWLIVISIIVIIGLFVFLIRELFKETTIKFASIEGDIMTATLSNGKVEKYKRDCNGDWNNYPMMTFVGRPFNNKLEDIRYYIKEWGNDYPTAHLKK